MTDPIVPSSIEDLPPAPKLVFVTLDQRGPASPGEIARLSTLPHRTVLEAVERLETAGVVEPTPHCQFGSTSEYRITES